MMQCQSCGMPLDKDPQGGGTEADGSRSTLYCSLCYKDGKFVCDCTAKEMQELVEGKLKEMKMNRLMRKMAVRQIPHLQRWRNKK